ncbi:ABC transporter permease [Kribbella antibiotica]|uniref:ABC transporter permease n=1 Tax=Kribbella antibiotica TaxID=190195 RepID=A0A4R4ZKM1_9ACTN|nr:ABC transporter permease [Kribbella antibiotica]TDD58149.1 ABC transporter permease [Kribbella antibiotica]
MFLRRALRYRWAQALVLAGISLLIGTCAVFAPWFSRAVEQTVMTETLTSQAIPAAWKLSSQTGVETVGGSAEGDPKSLDALVPADLKALFTPPVHGMRSTLTWRVPTMIPKEPSVAGTLVWRDGYCAQLTVVEGRCPQRPNEVIASIADKTTWDFTVGSSVQGKPSDNFDGGAQLTVVGFYRPLQARGEYWFGQYPTGHSRSPSDLDAGSTDHFFADLSTFTGKTWAPRFSSDTRVIPGVARIDDLARLQDATDTVNGNATQLGLNAENTSSLSTVIDQIQNQRSQGRTIIPLVMVQVALFGVVVLALALGAVVDQRRPEIALSRLRGTSARRTARSLITELGIPVLIGTLTGVATGFGLLLIARATWLRYGAPLELPWTVPAALVLAIVIGLLVVILQVRGGVRQTISSLLRRVPPRGRGWAVGIVDLCIIVFAVAGLAAAATGDGRGPLPVLTPALLSLAVGLTFAHLLLPTAGLISRRAARSGRLGLALGALQISRRPAVTRIVAAVAVAGGLLAFAGQAASVGDHNRETRAGYEVGAQAVLRTNGLSLGDFTKAINQIDPQRQWFTPVVMSRPPAPDSLKTMMIEPESFRRVAYRGDQLTDPAGWQALAAPAIKPIEFRSSKLTMTAAISSVQQLENPLKGGPDYDPARSLVLRASVVSLRNGSRYLVSFPPLPLTTKQPVALTASVDCLGGCQLLQLGFGREVLDQGGVSANVAISKVSTETQPSLTLGTATDWKGVEHLGGDAGSITAKAGGLLTLSVKSFSDEQFLQFGTVPTTVPAVITPEFRYAEGTTTSPASDGTPMFVSKLSNSTGPVNRYPDRTAVVDLETVRRLGGGLDEFATDFELWLNDAGLARVDQLTAAFSKAGYSVELSDVRSERIASYGRSASALTLQLTPVVGIAAWALAIVVLLLTVVTSWRSRAQDYASLRITGVPAPLTGRAARWEQTGPVALAVLLGSACGVIGAQIALPLIPLFADTGGPYPLELSTNWPVAIGLWAGGTIVLAVVTLLLGTGVNRRASYSRIREELT